MRLLVLVRSCDAAIPKPRQGGLSTEVGLEAGKWHRDLKALVSLRDFHVPENLVLRCELKEGKKEEKRQRV